MKKIFCIILCLTLFLCSCGNEVSHNENEKVIVTSFYPVMLIAKAVTNNADGIRIVNLTKPQTGCLHDYALLPEDIKTLEKCDAFVINGLGMESFIDKATANVPDLKVFDLSEGIMPLDDNAHIWLSPKNAAKMAENLCSYMSEFDARNKEKYEENTKKYIEEFNKLDEELKNGLNNVKSRDIVTFHEAFSYFADEFDLNVTGVIEREPGEEPTTSEIRETVDIIKGSSVAALFAEPQYSSNAADIISAETGLKVYTLDPIVTGDNTDDYDAYFVKMRENLKTLQEALGDK